MVEAVVKDENLGGKITFVGTGQTAVTGTPTLARLQGRFTVRIELSDSDVDAVVRQVILAKAAETKRKQAEPRRRPKRSRSRPTRDSKPQNDHMLGGGGREAERELRGEGEEGMAGHWEEGFSPSSNI